MFIWTGVALFLFIYKSIYAGIIWEVPIEIVGLTGISQSSYAIPKVVNQTPTPAATTTTSGTTGQGAP